MTINSYAALAAKQKLETFQYEPNELGPWDVELSISHCGICHSDVHLIDDDWQMSTFPLVPGHEIVGTVQALGANVKHLAKGQRVGIGWQRSACLTCEFCICGEENLCPQQQATCMGNYGGFAESIRMDSRFVFPVPEKLASENVGPLLCGGITVFSPLRRYDVRPTMKVGVNGIGGLGHLALQFAHAFGCEVTAFSTTPEKESEAKEFGAHHFICSKDSSAIEQAANSLDFILNTVYADIDWVSFLNILRPNGKLCTVGAAANPIMIPVFPLIAGQKTVCGSVIGGRRIIQEMLEFCARHHIKAKTEILPMSEVNTAIDKVRNGKARYRMVLKN
ncbi:MAG: NAD(P)-dependent alcohol dehydrogenase [bacterium]